jgi:dihydrodipicolinate synthase/N-acetylneuraminate lyase
MKASELGGYLVSVPIPWDESGHLLPVLFRGAIRKLLGEGCDGMYLFGTSGEGYAVSDAEFARIVEIFLDETAEFRGFCQVGCFGLSSDQVKHRCALAVERGARGVQITLPFWKELSDAEVFRYFADVCGSFPDLSFLLYNNPRNKRRLTGKELAEIQNRVPNLHGAKTGSGSWIDFLELLTESPAVRHFVTEPAFLFCRGLGAAGLIPSSNYARPKTCRRYYEAVLGGDLDTASKLHRDIVRFFYRTALPLVRKGYVDGAIDKAYARIGGMEMPLHMKSPYVGLSEEDFAWLESVIREWSNQ